MKRKVTRHTCILILFMKGLGNLGTVLPSENKTLDMNPVLRWHQSQRTDQTKRSSMGDGYPRSQCCARTIRQFL